MHDNAYSPETTDREKSAFSFVESRENFPPLLGQHKPKYFNLKDLIVQRDMKSYNEANSNFFDYHKHSSNDYDKMSTLKLKQIPKQPPKPILSTTPHSKLLNISRTEALNNIETSLLNLAK